MNLDGTDADRCHCASSSSVHGHVPLLPLPINFTWNSTFRSNKKNLKSVVPRKKR